MIKTSSLLVAAAIAVCLTAIDPTLARAAQVIEVRIANESEEPIRCVLVLAHFVTKTLPSIPAGGSLATTLERNPRDGTLSYGSFDGHPMMLENLLCGTLSDWTGTSRDLPILTMRSERATRFNYRCTLVNKRIACVAR